MGKEGMRYLAEFFGRRVGILAEFVYKYYNKCLQGLIQATGSTVFDVNLNTKPAFRAQILRDVPPKVAIFDTCLSCVKMSLKYDIFRTCNVFGLESWSFVRTLCPIIKPLWFPKVTAFL